MPKPRLQNGEWAILPEPCLKYHDADGSDVKYPQRQRIDPRPVIQIAQDDCQQSTNHKQYDSKVGNQDDISQKLVHGD